MTPGLWGPCTALPGAGLTPAQTHAFLSHQLALSPRRAAWLEALMAAAGIERRYTCVEEFCRVAEAGGDARVDWSEVLGGLEGRMARYGAAAADLAEAAARAVLRRADIGAREVTHLVFVTCTGFANPGPDAALAQRLGLPDDVHRLQVGFMGCQAAVQGLRLAAAISRGEPGAVVLLVCVELCTLHFDPARTDPEQLVVTSLFGDGAGAALISRRSTASPADFLLHRFASLRIPAGADLLTWDLGSPAFRMGVRRRLPDAVRAEVGRFVIPLVPPSTPPDELGWAVHPGGRAVLDAVQEALDLDEAQLAPSRGVLRDCGNMSSPTLLFVLEAMPLHRRAGVALAIGPGLSLEGCQWSRPPAR